MEEGRETRFTVDVLEQAIERLLTVKDRCMEDSDLEGHVAQGAAILDDLAWSTIAVYEAADLETSNLLEVVDSRVEQISTAFVDGLLLGALCADISYERSLGLV
jgi:hypothetical protein